MLPLKYRLKDRRSFSQVFSKGKYFSTGNFGMKVLRTGQPETRFGFSVGLKYSKKAVRRNKMKRWLRESVRSKMSHVKPGFDVIIFTTKTTADNLTYTTIGDEIQELFKKSNLLN